MMKMNFKTILSLSTALAIPTLALSEDGLKVKGWFDTYYQYDFNHSAFGTILSGREFDQKAGVFDLANAQINLSYGRKSLPFTVFLDLGLGRNVDVNNGLDTNNHLNGKFVQQGYVSIPLHDGSTLDIGKFNTWIGSESVYTLDNPNYSLGTLFWYGQPNWHVGTRWLKTYKDASTIGLYLVNGWNETSDTNADKTIGMSFSKSMNSKLSTTIGYIGGNEGTNGIGLPQTGLSQVHMVDLIATYASSDRVTFSLNSDYASCSGANSGHWFGYSIYSQTKLSTKESINFRFSTIDDPQNLRGAVGSVSSWTATLDSKVSEAGTIRLEFRYDSANTALFQSGTNGYSNNRTTLTLAHVLRF